jgi:hypothetical protein
MNFTQKDLQLKSRLTHLTRALYNHLPQFSHSQIMSALKVAIGYDWQESIESIEGFQFPFESGTYTETNSFVDELSKVLNKYATVKPNRLANSLAEILGFTSYEQLYYFQSVRAALRTDSRKLGKNTIRLPLCLKGKRYSDETY